MMRCCLKATLAAVLFGTSAVSAENPPSPPPPTSAPPLVIPVPEVTFPLPVAEHVLNNSLSPHRYNMASNPIAYILQGMNDIWTLGDAAWANGGADGDGPDDFSQTQILNASVWEYNMAYVLEVCEKRTVAEAVYAYLDETREQNYGVLDGLGPLLADYLTETGAVSTVTIDETSVMDASRDDQTDGGNGAGQTSSGLGKVVEMVNLMRWSDASTSGSKYFYSTPRPWRMTDVGEMDFVGSEILACHDGAGNTVHRVKDVYNSNVSMIPALKCIRRDSKTDANGAFLEHSAGKDGGYPSGHTNAGYLAALGIAYSIPERFAEMCTRASELGQSRILAGMHSPLDVIGGRVHAMAVVATALSKPANAELQKEAVQQASEFFSGLLSEGETLFEYAHANEAGRWEDHEANKALYRWRMTYGFQQDVSKSGQPATIPLGAEALLESRQPYLTSEQRRVVLFTTAIDSGYPILDDTNGWGRLDVVTASDGYGAFLADVVVVMNASLGGFHAHDWWRNDISGSGILTKSGSGLLTLTGDNTFSGGVIIEDGVLEAASATAMGTGDVVVGPAGTLRVDADSAVVFDNDVIISGSVLIDVTSSMAVADRVIIASGSLELVGGTSGQTYTVLTAKTIVGKFDAVSPSSVVLEYTKTSITAVF